MFPAKLLSAAACLAASLAELARRFQLRNPTSAPPINPAQTNPLISPTPTLPSTKDQPPYQPYTSPATNPAQTLIPILHQLSYEQTTKPVVNPTNPAINPAPTPPISLCAPRSIKCCPCAAGHAKGWSSLGGRRPHRMRQH